MADGLHESLRIFDRPSITDGTMVLALTGWMDGGDVSTGTVERLVEQTNADVIAEIDPDGYYVLNVPGPMEIAAMFRPHIEIEEGLLKHIEMPAARFYCDESRDLVFFMGREPNLGWQAFGDCIFAVASMLRVRRMLFVGSYAGAVPHTRQPRLYAAVSDESLMNRLAHYGVRGVSYEGPGSFATYLLSRSASEGMSMASLVAEIPAYIQGRNPASIEAVSRRLASILELPADLDELRTASDEWESQVTDAVDKDDDLAEKIRELEAAYDEDLLDQEQSGGWMAGDEEKSP
jgi:proteasome assembly chaperone (PAC2) family protein